MNPATEYRPTKEVTEEATLCCGFKKCPHVRIYEDGSITVTDDGAVIEFNPDQAKALYEMLGRSR